MRSGIRKRSDVIRRDITIKDLLQSAGMELSASFQLCQNEYYAQGKGNKHPWPGLLPGQHHPAREWGGSNALRLLTGN